MYRLDPRLLRRTARVRARMASDDPADAILDDFFVLWRAFEGSWPIRSRDTHVHRCRNAVSSVIDAFAWGELKELSMFIEALSDVERLSQKEIHQWFNVSWEEFGVFLDDVAEMQQALSSRRWVTHNSVVLADTLYGIRCAVVHSGLDTITAGRFKILPCARTALLELVVAHGCVIAGEPLESGFADLDKEIARHVAALGN